MSTPAILALAPVLGATLLGAAVQEPAEPAEPMRPGFVIFVADDLGWRDLGCSGSTFYDTPAIDALAASGMRFTQGYAASCVCSPTRAALLSGASPARLGTTDWFGGRRRGTLIPADYTDRLPLEEVTLAEALREAGYATGFFGKWHLGPEGFWPEDQGFDVNAGGFTRGSPPGGYFAPYQNPKLADGPAGENLTDRLTDEALVFLEEHADEPFLLYLSYYAVHTPLQTKPELEEHYAAKAAELPSAGPRFLPEGDREARQVQDHPVYAGMVATLDASVGRVLARLDELGIADRTVVVFTSDNGGLSTSEGRPTSNVPLRAGKGWLYEGGLRVPWIVRAPGVTAPGSRCDVPIGSWDLYPTVLALADLEPRPEQHTDGVDVTPLLRGQRALPERDALFWHYPHYSNQGGRPGSAIRVGRWKLIELFEEERLELYDLERDPDEQREVGLRNVDVVRDLEARLHAWRESVGARLPMPDPDPEKE